jgi:hypothetical protein
MNIIVNWAPDAISLLPTDEYDVLYKIADSANLNNWIVANLQQAPFGPLPAGTTQYTINNVLPNTVYRVAVAKSCSGTPTFVVEGQIIVEDCLITSFYQGPPVNGYPTLFYSMSSPDSNHLISNSVTMYDMTAGDYPFLLECANPCPNDLLFPVGRIIPIDEQCFTCPPFASTIYGGVCIKDSAKYLSPSGISSSAGYYGNYAVNPLCLGSSGPILFTYGNDYKLDYKNRNIDVNYNYEFPADLNLFTQSTNTCFSNIANYLAFTPTPIALDDARISGALLHDPITGEYSFSIEDGTGQTNIEEYTILYTSDDASLSSPLPLVDNSGAVITDFNVDYAVYCPVEILPILSPVQLSIGMTVEVFIYDPGLNNICNISNANYTGLTLAQACTSIASYITANTAYDANAVIINGTQYIRIVCPGVNVIASGEIKISGPSLMGPTSPDIFQVAPTSVTDFRIQSALIYDSGSGDKIYGARGFQGNDTGKIEVTDITTATTLEYNHPIAIQTSRLNLVDVAPPARAWNIDVSDAAGVGVGGINQDIVKTAAVWNTGYVYRLFYTDTTGTEIRVTDDAGTLIDSEFLSTITGNSECARLISVDQTNGIQLIVMVDDPSSPGQCIAEIIQHSAVANWVSVNTINNIPSANEVVKGTITGVVAPFAVVSSTQYSITVTGNPWTNNQYNLFTIEIITGASAGTKVQLYFYCPGPPCNLPYLTNFSNNTNTLFINPAASYGFDASVLAPGDQFVLLNDQDYIGEIYDINASYTAAQYNNYKITFEDATNPLLGNEFSIVGTSPTSIRVGPLGIGTYFNNITQTSPAPSITRLNYDTPYRIYKINDGDIVFNPVNNYWYHSCGNGQINVIDSVTGTLISTEQLLEPNSVTFANGSFQIAIDSLGEAYCIQRDSTNTDVGVTLIPIASKNIYRLNASGFALAAINGSILWNENIAGNISVYDDGVNEHLFFTSIDTRKIYKYNISANTFISKTVPSVYKKSSAVEKIQGAVHIENEFMIIMNKLSSSPSANILNDYTFTNLFVYDFAGNSIEQVLVGADSTPYAGATINWNLGIYGETFAEYNLAKDYGLGGLSIKVNGSLPSARIFWKQWTTDNYYQSQGFVETGVAQLWGICIGESGGDLIKIWNIQSNGSLQASNRTLYTYGGTRSYTNLPVKMEYDTFYNHVVGVTFASQSLVLIDPVNFTGYHGGPYYGNYNVSTNKLAIDTLASGTLVFPTDFITNNQGTITIFGGKNSSVNSIYVRYTSVDITGPNNSFTSTGTLGDGSSPNPGLFYLGYNPGYSQVYNPSSNQIWLMARNIPDICENPPCPPNALTTQDVVIGILDHDTLNVIDVINLSNQNADPIGSVGYYFLGFYIPALDLMCYIGGFNGKLLLINATTRQTVYNGSLVPAANFLRTPPLLLTSYYGWMVPYNNGVFLDYTINTLLNERWVYLTPQTVTYTGLTHNILTINVEGVDILLQDDVYATTLTGNTFGQWKVLTDDTWASIPGSGTITINPNEIIEFVMFDKQIKLIEVENLSTATIYDLANYTDLSTLPTFNNKNFIRNFSIKADNINVSNGDQLKFTFSNPANANNPFINTVILNF